jgi:hypothetical protein
MNKLIVEKKGNIYGTKLAEHFEIDLNNATSEFETIVDVLTLLQAAGYSREYLHKGIAELNSGRHDLRERGANQ